MTDFFDDLERELRRAHRRDIESHARSRVFDLRRLPASARPARERWWRSPWSSPSSRPCWPSGASRASNSRRRRSPARPRPRASRPGRWSGSAMPGTIGHGSSPPPGPLRCNMYMGQPACWSFWPANGWGRPRPIPNCTRPSRAFRRSFQGASVQEIAINGDRAAARFSNGETVERVGGGGDSPGWSTRLARTQAAGSSSSASDDTAQRAE